MLKNLAKGFADLTHHKPVGIPRVVDKIVWINVIDSDGEKHVIPGYIGETMLLTLEKNKIFIPAQCRGGDLQIPEYEEPADPLKYGPTCSECQVEVGEPWANYIKPIGFWERDRITKSPTGFFTKYSRLACSFILHKWMDGMQIVIPLNLDQKMELDNAYLHNGANRIHNT